MTAAPLTRRCGALLLRRQSTQIVFVFCPAFPSGGLTPLQMHSACCRQIRVRQSSSDSTLRRRRQALKPVAPVGWLSPKLGTHDDVLATILLVIDSAAFSKENVLEVGQARDYVEECLRRKGDIYNRALQDLVNHIGELLGFEIKHGQYRGVMGEIGHVGGRPPASRLFLRSRQQRRTQQKPQRF